MLSQVLNNRNTTMVIASSALSLSMVSTIPLEPENTPKVVLALSTLGNFNFEGLQ